MNADAKEKTMPDRQKSIPTHSEIRALRDPVGLESQSPDDDGTRRENIVQAFDGIEESLTSAWSALSEKDVETMDHDLGEIESRVAIARRNLKGVR